MKKHLLLVSLISFCLTTFAQDKIYKSVTTNFLTAKFEDAKREIEKIAEDNRYANTLETWLWKARIYSELFFDEKTRDKYPGIGNLAFEAFKKYESLEPDYKQLTEKTISWRPLDLLYVGSFGVGRKFFENKQWDSAYYSFLVTVYMGDVIVKTNLRGTNAKVDTVSILYAAYSAQNAKKDKEASLLYEKLADNRISGTEIKDAYAYILITAAKYNYRDKFFKYYEIAKEVYKDEDWIDYEFEFMKNFSATEKTDAYKKDVASGNASARKFLLYGQLFSDVSREDDIEKDSLKKSEYEHLALDAFTKAYNLDNTQGIAAFNAGVFYYNEFGIYDDRMSNNRRALQQLNANRPVEKDPKKKAAADADFKAKSDAIKNANAAIEKSLTENVDNAILWLERAFDVLQKGDTKDRTIRNCLNNSVKWLANCYMYKREKAKGNAKLYDEYDAKYKKYDELYNKF
jgi:hypothetical protein